MSMPDQFVVTLRNEKMKYYQNLGIIFIGLMVISFILFLFIKDTRWAGAIGIVTTLIYFLVKRYQRKRNPEILLVDEKAFFMLAAVWLWLNVFMALLVLLTGIFFSIALQKFSYIFNDEGIFKNFYPKKKYEWNEMDSVILKGGYLTINFKNDHLIQGRTEENITFSDYDFNVFAEKHLVKDQALENNQNPI